jgi:hypothetical protein
MFRLLAIRRELTTKLLKTQSNKLVFTILLYVNVQVMLKFTLYKYTNNSTVIHGKYCFMTLDKHQMSCIIYIVNFNIYTM